MGADRFATALERLLEEAHTAAPDEIADLLARAAGEFGLTSAVVYLADVQQRTLTPLPGSASGAGEACEGMPIEGTLAGWAYRTQSMRIAARGDLVLWLPVVDGLARLGVLRATAGELTADLVAHCRSLASVLALIVAAESGYSDTVARTTRAMPMSVAAEMVWAFLPPRTVGTTRVTSTGLLEPAYEIAGDAYDHGLDGSTLHFTVVDAMGHDLASGLSSSVALAGCRASRRADASLGELVRNVDRQLGQWLPGRMLTGIFARLDLDTGTLLWANCGHPPPLLVREHGIVPGALARRPELPLGLGPGARAEHAVHHAALQPGDRVLVYTDGITEARSASGEFFGEQRLADFVIRATAAGEPASETARRLIHAIMDHHRGRLRDDATVLITEWHPTAGGGSRPEDPGGTGAPPAQQAPARTAPGRVD